MHAGIHVEGAFKLLSAKRPKVLQFLLDNMKNQFEIERFLDAPDHLDHSATNGSHSYKLEKVGDALKPHILSGTNKHTVLTRLDGDFSEMSDFMSEGRPDVVAMLICKSIHWRIDARTPPHIEWKWADRAHASFENDADKLLDEVFKTITEWPERPLTDIYKSVRADLFQAYYDYEGLKDIYESGKHASDERIAQVLTGVCQQLNRYLAHVERVVLTKKGA